MKFNYLKSKDNRNLISGIFTLSFFKEETPLKVTILPNGIPSLVYLSADNQKFSIKNSKTESTVQGLSLFSQFDSSYSYSTLNKTNNFGVILSPTSMYKITGQDVSNLTNKISSLSDINPLLSKKIENIFIENQLNLSKFKKDFTELLNNINLTEDEDIIYIEKAVDYILKKEGIVKVKDLLELVPFSQKSLQTKFKKIVGLTPVKFIKITRFKNFLIRYRVNKDDVNELLTTFNYYDMSHFNRDFKLMMHQSPKSFFEQKDQSFLDQYLSI